MQEIAKENALEDHFRIQGAACSPNLVFGDKEGNASLEYKTVFVQEMIRQHIILSSVSLAYQHTETEIDMTLEAARKAMRVYADALNGNVRDFIEGEPIKPVFRKYN